MKEPISFTAFWRTLLFTPHTFFRQYLAPEVPRPYWWVVVSFFLAIYLVIFQFIYCIVAGFERVSMSEQAWLLGASLLGGLLVYFLVGWCMKLVILLCGIKVSVKQARSIALYTGALPNLCLLLLFLISWLGRYWSFFVITYIVSWVIFLPYSVYVRYCAVMTLPGAKKGRVIFVFILATLISTFWFANGVQTR